MPSLWWLSYYLITLQLFRIISNKKVFLLAQGAGTTKHPWSHTLFVSRFAFPVVECVCLLQKILYCPKTNMKPETRVKNEEKWKQGREWLLGSCLLEYKIKMLFYFNNGRENDLKFKIRWNQRVSNNVVKKKKTEKNMSLLLLQSCKIVCE